MLSGDKMKMNDERLMYLRAGRSCGALSLLTPSADQGDAEARALWVVEALGRLPARPGLLRKLALTGEGASAGSGQRETPAAHRESSGCGFPMGTRYTPLGSASQFPLATVTNDHRPWGWKQHKFILSTFWRQKTAIKVSVGHTVSTGFRGQSVLCLFLH